MSNKTLKCIIVDDEPLALEILESHINNTEGLELAKKCVHAIEASEAIKKENPDVVFLDINMPEVSGLDLAQSLSGGPLVVFTTAYEEYAVEAFEINAIDYLLKPISPDRFSKAVDRVKEYVDLRSNDSSTQPEELESEEDFIYVKSEQRLIKIAYNDIFYIEALADYVKIHIAGNKRIITLQTMKNMAAKLPADKFSRVHRSFIVNLKYIKSLSTNKIELNDKQIPIGKNYKEDFMNKINKNLF
jgi:DNA-binding LytR/AlgR family response regulator